MKSKKWLFFVILIITTPLLATTIEVCSDCQIKTIKAALSVAKPNDIIKVKKGVYKETNLIIDKSLTIIGENQPTIDGQLKGDIFKIKSDKVVIKGFNIINVGKDFANSNTAIRVQKSNNFEISYNRFENILFAVYIEKSSYGKIINNKIFGNAKTEINSGNGIHLWDSKHILITNNYIEKMRDGIYLEFASNCEVVNNFSTKNVRYGLHFMFSNDNSYLKNKFLSNGAGVAVMFSKRIKMMNNQFLKNWGTASYGLLLKEINDAEIKHNIFEENTIAINVEGSNRIDYENNNFTRNGWALKVRGACYNNVFKKNNFLYNSFDVSWNSKMNDNLFEHNYWSEYSGYDLDKNGVGDVPYRPVKLFSYIVNKTPETIILLRSLFINLVDFSEKVTPVFTPDFLIDNQPQMKPIL
ncbi:MAG: nitrous oxide reductase family maturation protein NosD [Flavobacteriaceae bacterium]|nr:nitrous oxide reductase family maturation protein NosD [Flavobacteriaceae bacterium]